MDGDYKIVGKKIVDIRRLNPDELEKHGWDGRDDINWVLVLDDGSIVYASSDPEGNEQGSIWIDAPAENYYLGEDLK